MWESVCKPLVSVILQSAYPNMSGLTRRVGLSEGDCITKKNQEDRSSFSRSVYTVDTVYDCVVFQFRGTIRLCEFKAPDFSTSTMVPFRNRFEDLDDKSTLWRLLVGSSNLWVGRAKEKLTLC